MLSDSWSDEHTLRAFFDANGNITTNRRRKHEFTFIAIEQGAVKIVEALLESGVDLNHSRPFKRWHSHRTFLGATRHAEIAHMLLKAGADINAPPFANDATYVVETALFQPDIELARVLIDAGAPYHPRKIDWVLGLRIRNGNPKAVKSLLGLGLRWFWPLTGRWDTTLPRAILDSHKEVLFANMQMPWAKSALLGAKYSWVLLRNAAEAGDVDTVKLLIAAGADVNATPDITERLQRDDLKGMYYRDKERDVMSRYPSTALAAAVEYGHADVVRTLLSCSPYVNAPILSEYGKNALEIAAHLGHTEIYLLLKGHGASTFSGPLTRVHRMFEIAFALRRNDEQRVKELYHDGVDIPHIFDFVSPLAPQAPPPKSRPALQAIARIIILVFLDGSPRISTREVL
jgi:ankyrin repeat protein